jgi:hypothetical protein
MTYDPVKSKEFPCIDCLCVSVCKHKSELNLFRDCGLVFTYVYCDEAKDGFMADPFTVSKRLSIIRNIFLGRY